MCIRQRCRHSKCNHGLQAAWEVFDTDGDGLITSGDLCLLLKTYGFDHSEAEQACLFFSLCAYKDKYKRV